MMQIQMEDLGAIRFTAVPRGGAPLQIREQLIGVEVPCLFSYDGVPPDSGDNAGDMETGLGAPDRPGYIVLQIHVLKALEKKSPEAVGYWESVGFPYHPFAVFLFDHSSAEVVKSVKTREEFWESFNDA